MQKPTNKPSLLQRRNLLGQQSLHLEVLFSLETPASGRNLPQIKILSFTKHFIYQILGVGNQRLIIYLLHSLRRIVLTLLISAPRRSLRPRDLTHSCHPVLHLLLLLELVFFVEFPISYLRRLPI